MHTWFNRATGYIFVSNKDKIRNPLFQHSVWMSQYLWAIKTDTFSKLDCACDYNVTDWFNNQNNVKVQHQNKKPASPKWNFYSYKNWRNKTKSSLVKWHVCDSSCSALSPTLKSVEVYAREDTQSFGAMSSRLSLSLSQKTARAVVQSWQPTTKVNNHLNFM